jgi:hypothetical protein
LLLSGTTSVNLSQEHEATPRFRSRKAFGELEREGGHLLQYRDAHCALYLLLISPPCHIVAFTASLQNMTEHQLTRKSNFQGVQSYPFRVTPTTVGSGTALRSHRKALDIRDSRVDGKCVTDLWGATPPLDLPILRFFPHRSDRCCVG